MKQWLRTSVCALAAGALAVAAVARRADAATPAEVNAAIDKGKAYLYSQINKDNNWELVPKPEGKGNEGQADPKAKQWGGLSGLAVYGLLAAGENPQNPKLRPAIEWLKTAPLVGTYATGMRAQVWPFLQEKEAKASSKADFAYLLKALHDDAKKKEHFALYPYFIDIPMDRYGQPDLAKVKPQDWSDHSVSQIGVLGMWACEQAGQEVPSEYWRVVDARWKADQQKDGGWFYNQGNAKVTGTMTAAGVATLYITQDYLLLNHKWDVCNGGIRNEHIEAGLRWMDRNVEAMIKNGDHYYYGMYGIERIGVASGRKYFGTIDWYKAGAEQLVRKQGADGGWGGDSPPHNPKKIPDTVFSMLFLIRGRAPVIMNKLEYANGGEANAAAAAAPAAPGGDAKPADTMPATPAPAAKPPARAAGPANAKRQDDPWNERPRDVANFTNWSSKRLEKYLNWHIVNLRVPAEDLLDAPILYISGSEALNLSQAEVNKLREFVEAGGLILGNADCGNAAFTKSFVALGRQLFPKYEFRELPITHPIYTDQQYRPAKWKAKVKVEGLSNDVRELMILIPLADPARSWQTRADKTRAEMFELTQNIVLYTLGKTELRYRGETHFVKADPSVTPASTVKVVRVIAGDNPDPEPGAWRRLASVLHNTNKTGVTLTTAKLGEGKLQGAQLAHLTGTSRFKLNPAQQAELKAFVAGGGTLVVDAAGGRTDFAISAEAELAAIFGDAGKGGGKILEPAHAVYSTGGKIEKFAYRPFVRGRVAGGLNAPRIRGIEQNGRVAVFFSPEDLTAGLVGQPTDGILGYDPGTATEIMRNIVSYAAKGGAGVAAKADAGAEK